MNIPAWTFFFAFVVSSALAVYLYRKARLWNIHATAHCEIGQALADQLKYSLKQTDEAIAAAKGWEAKWKEHGVTSHTLYRTYDKRVTELETELTKWRTMTADSEADAERLAAVVQAHVDQMEKIAKECFDIEPPVMREEREALLLHAEALRLRTTSNHEQPTSTTEPQSTPAPAASAN